MSKLFELRSLEAKIAELNEIKEKLEPQVRDRIELLNKICQTLDERGISRREMALELCPELVKGAANTQGKQTRRPRVMKVYENPNTGDRIETKGGNHKILKAWKSEYGNDVVESWLQTGTEA